jgi:retrograde regulation protein 2
MRVSSESPDRDGLTHRPAIPGLPGQGDKKYLRGIVDMGSNGIRFSVSDLSPPLTRILPTVYVYRYDLSLYNEQFDPVTGRKIPIPRSVIAEVVGALLRFKIICKDLGVHDDRIRILATEATRTAINSGELRKAIEDSTGIKMEILAKEDEGRIGALGIASSFSDMAGLAMDLGGGSTQITWMSTHNGTITTSPKGAFSFPYGAAALTRRLADLEMGKSPEEAEKARNKLRKEIKDNFLDAYHKLEVPADMKARAEAEGGFPLYLSGGGFRGWGYLLLYLNQKHGHHYPISIINGFRAPRSEFEDTKRLEEIARTSRKIFRVSDRRRGQVPAVAFLVNVLSGAIPHGIKEARFCQGGVREGILFQELDPAVRVLDPLQVATSLFSRESVDAISKLLLNSIPPALPGDPSNHGRRHFPPRISHHVIHALANTMYVHQIMSKESASTAALYSTSTGLLSSVHGISHIDRAMLALVLEARYQGEMPPREEQFKASLREILTYQEAWWMEYLGKVAMLVNRLYPSGSVDARAPRIGLRAEWVEHAGKKGDKDGVKLIIIVEKKDNDPMKLAEAIRDNVGILEKVGKKKRWIGPNREWGLHVDVQVVEEEILETRSS